MIRGVLPLGVRVGAIGAGIVMVDIAFSRREKSFSDSPFLAYGETTLTNPNPALSDELKRSNAVFRFAQARANDGCIVEYDIRGLSPNKHKLVIGTQTTELEPAKNGSFVGKVTLSKNASVKLIGQPIKILDKDEKDVISSGKIQSFPILASCSVSPQGKPCTGNDIGNVCQGIVHLKQNNFDECEIKYDIKGLSQGKHGFHVHEKADFSNGCISAGPHYNPFGKTHGGPSDEERHVGDLGNIEPDKNGNASGTILDPQIKLFGHESVIGRSFMVHAEIDDLGKGGHNLSLTTGNAGARIACGEIKLKLK